MFFAVEAVTLTEESSLTGQTLRSANMRASGCMCISRLHEGKFTTNPKPDYKMAAGDTVFGDHETLIARVPSLMTSTEKAIGDGQHPLIVAAKWHGYYEYLHPFRDGNGRTGRLLSNFILLRAGHPLLIIELKDRSEYISALKQIRIEGSDEFLIAFFFKTAIGRMKNELSQKRKNSLPMMFF